MATLFDRFRGDSGASGSSARGIDTVDDYALAVKQAYEAYAPQFGLGGGSPTTWGRTPVETVSADFEGFARQLYGDNGLIFAVMGCRMVAFSLARFRWQRLRDGKPGRMFGGPDLAILERPWPGGTTQDLLARMIQDADLAGNNYTVRIGGRLVRLRPDWVRIIMEAIESPSGAIIGWNNLAYAYRDGGWNGDYAADDEQTAVFMANDVSHFAPLPDPLAPYRGMSWITPILREIVNDKMMNKHKTKFFENAATPNITVALDRAIGTEAFGKFKAMMDEQHRGVDNAYKTLYLGGGADVKVIGANLQQIDLKNIQGHGETRVAAAGGVPAIIVGLSEGLASGTYSNYGQARRRFADLTMASLWSNAAGCLQPLCPPPGNTPSGGADARLWWDSTDVAFLREDRKDAAEILSLKAAAMTSLVNGGFDPTSVIDAVEADDLAQLVHTGLLSVQVQPPGTTFDKGGGSSAGTGDAGSGGSSTDDGDDPDAGGTNAADVEASTVERREIAAAGGNDT